MYKPFHTLAVVSLITMFVESGCFSDSNKSKRATHIDFETTEINMGKLTHNLLSTATFSFKNTGDNPLVIYSVEVSCWCTRPQYPVVPISPGEEGEIKVTYDAKVPGRFNKTITIYHNGDKNFDVLKINGSVVVCNTTN